MRTDKGSLIFYLFECSADTECHLFGIESIAFGINAEIGRDAAVAHQYVFESDVLVDARLLFPLDGAFVVQIGATLQMYDKGAEPVVVLHCQAHVFGATRTVGHFVMPVVEAQAQAIVGVKAVHEVGHDVVLQVGRLVVLEEDAARAQHHTAVEVRAEWRAVLVGQGLFRLASLYFGQCLVAVA